jgi:hypothetical protein
MYKSLMMVLTLLATSSRHPADSKHRAANCLF